MSTYQERHLIANLSKSSSSAAPGEGDARPFGERDGGERARDALFAGWIRDELGERPDGLADARW